MEIDLTTAAATTTRVPGWASAITSRFSLPSSLRMTTARLVQIGSLAAVVAGLLFVAIQFIHPADELASVTTSTWQIIHLVSLFMVILFVFGITTIYASQAVKAGWLGFAGLVVLTAGLFMTAIGDVIEAFVEPVIATTSPEFVEGMMALIHGSGSTAVGAVATVWSISSAAFLIGTITYGIAMLRAGVISRVASALFGFGLVISVPLVAITGVYRLAAVPIGLGLAWMGYSAWSNHRANRTNEMANLDA
jgi:hypothetical protein